MKDEQYKYMEIKDYLDNTNVKTLANVVRESVLKECCDKNLAERIINNINEYLRYNSNKQ